MKSKMIILLLIPLLSVTATNKLIDYKRFTFQLELVPLQIIALNATLLAILIPVSELCLAIGLCFKRYRLFSLYGTLLLLIALEIYIISQLFFSRSPACTCTGMSASLGWKAQFLINSVLCILTLCSLCLKR